jgi:hypothetical protein
MRPVQSNGRRRQGHPADNAPDRSAGKQCARAEAVHRTHHPFYKKPSLHAEDMKISGVRALEDRLSSTRSWLQVQYSLSP